MQATTWACACSESSRGCDAADGVRDATLHVGSPSLSLLPAALPVAWCAASIAMPHKEQTEKRNLDMNDDDDMIRELPVGPTRGKDQVPWSHGQKHPFGVLNLFSSCFPASGHDWTIRSSHF